MHWQLQIYYISKILWGVGFCVSAQKSLFIFYNSFSLRMTENLHEQKHFQKTWSTYFVYIIFLKMYNFFFLVRSSMTRSIPVKNRLYHSSWGQSSTTCSNCTEIAEWAAPSCSQPQPAMDNFVETLNPIDWHYPHPLHGRTPWAPLAHTTARCKSEVLSGDSIPGPLEH